MEKEMEATVFSLEFRGYRENGKENGNYHILFRANLGFRVWGLYRVNGKEHGNYYVVYCCYIGIIEKKMEPTM